MFVTNQNKGFIIVSGKAPPTGLPSHPILKPVYAGVRKFFQRCSHMIRNLFVCRSLGLSSSFFVFAVHALGQASVLPSDHDAGDGGASIWPWMALLAFASIGGALFLWARRKADEDEVAYNNKSLYATYSREKGVRGDENVDATKELESLRTTTKNSRRSDPKGDLGFKARRNGQAPDTEAKTFQEKMRKLQYSQLPINAFSQLAPAKRYTPLPESNDPALISAIEQASDEYEEDESVRELALRILAAFKNGNSIEALSQMALYDLSSNLRSKAVAALAEFDHESVFETILLACADPTREVRAAAARGLFSLGFDRAHAWKRLIEANDSFRLTSAARAAVESGIVDRSFDRLIHDDSKVAYEAFALVALLIKAGETNEIFNAIETHKDERVRFALLHVLKAQKDERTIEELTRLALALSKKPELLDRIKETMAAIQAGVQHEAWQVS